MEQTLQLLITFLGGANDVSTAQVIAEAEGVAGVLAFLKAGDRVHALLEAEAQLAALVP